MFLVVTVHLCGYSSLTIPHFILPLPALICTVPTCRYSIKSRERERVRSVDHFQGGKIIIASSTVYDFAIWGQPVMCDGSFKYTNPLPLQWQEMLQHHIAQIYNLKLHFIFQHSWAPSQRVCFGMNHATPKTVTCIDNTNNNETATCISSMLDSF